MKITNNSTKRVFLLDGTAIGPNETIYKNVDTGSELYKQIKQLAKLGKISAF